jgi:hypothetical protein
MNYFGIGSPMILSVIFDYWIWEQMTLAAGILSIDIQVVQVILINIFAINIIIGAGI